MKTISTADCLDIREGRRVGNSTRQANFAIDYLFCGYKIKLDNHSGIEVVNENLIDIILDRLDREHGIDLSGPYLIFDKDENTIQLSPEGIAGLAKNQNNQKL